MKYLYILLFMTGTITLQATNALKLKSPCTMQADLDYDDFIFSSVSFESDDCGTVTIDGWSSWSGGSCTGYCYDISSDCGSSNISGAKAPSGLLNGDGTISKRYMQAQPVIQQYN